MNASSGYIGWSMSKRAVAAYENGEMRGLQTQMNS